jgi:glycine/D-amino acid oxidase-like deaminating enzyme
MIEDARRISPGTIIEADLCIVGGGFSGLNTAIELAQKGFSVALLEAHKIGWGASGRNGGQLIRGVGHGVEQFESVIGAQGVRELKLMGLEAVEIVRERIQHFAIDCDLTWGYCDLANKPSHLEGFAEDMAELKQLGYRHEMRLLQPEQMHEVDGSDRYVGGMIDMGSGHLHPLNLALGEAAAAQGLGVQGAAFVGINPIHAGFPADPGNYSPYAPSHRRRLNVQQPRGPTR